MSRRNLVTAHQANYLPYLGFFQKILVSDLFVLVDDTQFVKRGAFGWIHRNKILSPNGPIWLTVPVKTHDAYFQTIAETECADNASWRRKHLKSVQVAYRKSPFFDEFYPGIEKLYSSDYRFLFDYSKDFIFWVLEVLNIRIPVQISSDLKLEGKGSEYVLDLAQKTNATHYLSGMHGKDYLELDRFKSENMGLVFQDFTCVEYKQQFGNEFVPYLSIIDALFNVGVEGTLALMRKGENYEVPEKEF